MKIIHLEL
jgi:hypothetical protein